MPNPMNQRDHDEFELAVELLRKRKNVEQQSAALRGVYAAAFGYLGRTILAKHPNAKWLVLDWDNEPPERLHPESIYDDAGTYIEHCDEVDEDLYRVPSWLDEGEILDLYAERVGASAYRLDLVKASRCYVPFRISGVLDRRYAREAQKASAGS